MNMLKQAILGACVLCAASSAWAQKPKTTPKTNGKDKTTPTTTTTTTTTVEADKFSQALAVAIAENLKSNGVKATDVNAKDFMKAFEDALNGKAPMDVMAAQTEVNNKITALQAAKSKEQEKGGKDFLAANKSKAGVITTASGLQYEVLRPADGNKPSLADKVKVHYHGTLIDGTVFDSSVDRGQPISFPLGGVIQGWQEGLQLMPVGSKFRLYIPHELGYGSRPAGKIPPFSTLIFEVELLGINVE